MRKKEELMNNNSGGPSSLRAVSPANSKKTTRTSPYCCFRFRESVKVDKTIIKAKGYDETEWHLPEGGHIYFCPFCGHKVKGKGFGTYKLAALTVEEMKELRKRTASKTATALGQRREKRTRNA